MSLRQFTPEELWCEDLGPAIQEAALEIFLRREAGLDDARSEARFRIEHAMRQNGNALVLPIDIDALVERDAQQICARRLNDRKMDINVIPEADLRVAARFINEHVALKLASSMPVSLYWPDAKTSVGSFNEIASLPDQRVTQHAIPMRAAL